MKSGLKKDIVNIAIITVIFVPLFIVAYKFSPHGEHAHGFDWLGFAFSWYNFIILIYLIVRFAGPAIRDYFNKRSLDIERKFEEAKRLRAEAERLIEEYKHKLEEFAKIKEQELERYLKEAEREKQEIIENAKKRIEKIQQDMMLAMETKVKKAKEDFVREVSEQVVREAEELIRKELTDTDHRRLIKKIVDKLQINQ